MRSSSLRSFTSLASLAPFTHYARTAPKTCNAAHLLGALYCRCSFGTRCLPKKSAEGSEGKFAFASLFSFLPREIRLSRDGVRDYVNFRERNIVDTARLLDVLINGPVNATTADTRNRAELVDAICADIAAGSDVTDACAASSVAPGAFLAWTVDDDDVAAAYARALKIRARLLADAPIAAARRIRHAAEVSGMDARMLGAYVGAVKAEVELTANVSEKGEPTPRAGRDGDQSENVVRIVFDPLPVHHQVAPTDTQSALERAEPAQLSASVPASYVVVDELDG